MKSGIELIAQERIEQEVKHGWTKQHDLDAHYDNELAQTAAFLCCIEKEYNPMVPEWGYVLKNKLKGDRIHELKVAGALIAAEIDRLQNNQND